MFIKFKTIRWKNFLATGNDWIEIHLDQHEKTLIYGENGAGKSTLLDALTFALFGKAFRNINKPTLVNSINGEMCEVQLEFLIGQKFYKIVRGIKPNLFEIYCDGKLLNQTGVIDYQDFLETNILKFNFKTFKQIMALGSKSFVPFMKLPALDRRNVIEELLDILIFSAMAKVTRNRLDHCRDEIYDVDRKIVVTDEKIALQRKNIVDNTTRNRERIATNLQIISNGLETISILEDLINETSETIQTLWTKTKHQKDLQTKRQQLDKLESKISHNLNKFKKDHGFFKDNENCPTCKQDIALQFRNDQIKHHKTKISELEEGLSQINQKLQETVLQLDDINKNLLEINRYQAEILVNNQKIEQHRNRELELLKENQHLKMLTFDAETSDLQLQQFLVEVQELRTKKETLQSKKKHLETIAMLLKDGGIKTSIVKQYLPVMNGFINTNLSFMDFDINFVLNENFEEAILARYRDKFAYENFSDGQQLRIDLALLFAWRSVAKVKNSVDTNILIMDEIVDSSLDNQGLEDFFRLISTFKETNIFIISPKGDTLVDRFDHTIKFELKNNFSEMI